MSSNNRQLHIRLAPPLYSAMVAEARDREISLNELCTQILSDWTPHSRHYYERQLGAQIVMALAVSSKVALKTLTGDEIVAAGALGRAVAAQLFGVVPKRPFSDDLEHPTDRRIEELHKIMLEK